jgi:hypothetical protein
MTRFVQRFPWEGFSKRILTLEPDKLVIDSKKTGAIFSDDYRYKDISPVVKTTRRGQTEWSNVIYGIVVASLALFLVTQMTRSNLIKLIIIAMTYAALFFAAFLFALRFKKNNYADFCDLHGECFLSIKVTAKSKPFIAALRQKISETGSDNAVRA